MVSDCLFKRNSTYYFRLNIPQDIAPYFSRKEIWKSLKTKNYKSAKATISKLLYHTEWLFLHLRSGMYTDIQMKQLVKEYLHSYLNRCENMRSIGIVRYETEGQKQISADTSVEAIDVLIESSKRKLLTNDFSGISARIGWYIEEKGLTLDKESIEYTSFCREILKAEIEALKVEKERMSGNYDNRYDNFLENTITPAVPAIEQPAIIDTPSAPVVTLSTVIEGNIKEAELGGNWNEKTKAENESIYKVITDVLGDVDIKSINHQTMMQFRDNLSKLPPNRDKIPKYKGKTIEQILAMKNVDAMSRTTLNKYLVRTSSLFKWAVKHGYIQTNVAEGLTLPKVRRADQEREAYSTEDIQKIVNHLEYDKADPHRFWIPILGMYQGMRLDEICQLYVSDIVVIDDVPCISVNSDADKKLKNAASERIIPVHPTLVRLGFLEYVVELRRQEETRLWGKLTKKRDGYSQDFGKWYQRFNRNNVTENPKRVFHSFRHSLADRLKQAGVQEALIAEILGHSHDSVTMTRYGKRYEPKVLLEALEKLDYGLESK
jgi:integrase